MTDDLPKRLRSVAEEAAERMEELQRIFDLEGESDRRAIKRWHDAGNPEHVWPDRTDMVVWLMGEHDRLTKEVERLQSALSDAGWRANADRQGGA